MYTLLCEHPLCFANIRSALQTSALLSSPLLSSLLCSANIHLALLCYHLLCSAVDICTALFFSLSNNQVCFLSLSSVCSLDTESIPGMECEFSQDVLDQLGCGGYVGPVGHSKQQPVGPSFHKSSPGPGLGSKRTLRTPSRNNPGALHKYSAM